MAELPIGRKPIYSVDWVVGWYLSLIVLSATVLVWEMFLSLNFIRKDIAILERSFEWVELFVALSSFIVIYSAIGFGKYFSKCLCSKVLKLIYIHVKIFSFRLWYICTTHGCHIYFGYEYKTK